MAKWREAPVAPEPTKSRDSLDAYLDLWDRQNAVGMTHEQQLEDDAYRSLVGLIERHPDMDWETDVRKWELGHPNWPLDREGNIRG